MVARKTLLTLHQDEPMSELCTAPEKESSKALQKASTFGNSYPNDLKAQVTKALRQGFTGTWEAKFILGSEKMSGDQVKCRKLSGRLQEDLTCRSQWGGSFKSPPPKTA